MAIDPDVQVIVDDLVVVLDNLKARVSALEAGGGGGNLFPDTIEQTYPDGVVVTYQKV